MPEEGQAISIFGFLRTTDIHRVYLISLGAFGSRDAEKFRPRFNSLGGGGLFGNNSSSNQGGGLFGNSGNSGMNTNNRPGGNGLFGGG